MDIIYCRFEFVRLVNFEYFGCSFGDGYLFLECYYMYYSIVFKYVVRERLYNRFVLDFRGRNFGGGD